MIKKLSEMTHDEIGDMLDAMNDLVRSGLPSDATFVLSVSRADSDQTYTTTSATTVDPAAAQRYLDMLEEK